MSPWFSYYSSTFGAFSPGAGVVCLRHVCDDYLMYGLPIIPCQRPALGGRIGHAGPFPGRPFRPNTSVRQNLIPALYISGRGRVGDVGQHQSDRQLLFQCLMCPSGVVNIHTLDGCIYLVGLVMMTIGILAGGWTTVAR